MNLLRISFHLVSIILISLTMRGSFLQPLRAMYTEEERNKNVSSSSYQQNNTSFFTGVTSTEHLELAKKPTLPQSKKEVWILSIDGGGIRGIIPARILLYLEEELKNTLRSRLKSKIEGSLGSQLDSEEKVPFTPHLAKFFDVMAGTSTGGIITLGLNVPDPQEQTLPRFGVSTLVNLYEKHGNEVFTPGVRNSLLCNIFIPKFDAHGLETLLNTYFCESTLKDTISKVIIPAYEVRQERLYLFDSDKARTSSADDFFMKDVARSTSAAPTFFPAASSNSGNTQCQDSYRFVDGGIIANNPAMAAFTRAKELFPDIKKIHLVSLGTGTAPFDDLSEKQNGGLWTWRQIPKVMIDSASEFTHTMLKSMSETSGGTFFYYRFQPILTDKRKKMDNVDPENLAYLAAAAKNLITDNSQQLKNIIEKLADSYESQHHPLFPATRKDLDERLNSSFPSLSLLGFDLKSIFLVWDITAYLQHQNPTTFNILKLEGTNLTDRGLLLLIKTLPSLNRLNVRDNRLSDQSVKNIVQHLPYLTYLDVSFNKMTPKGIENLTNGLSKLSFLGLSSDQIQDANIEQIDQRLSKRAKESILYLARQGSRPALKWMRCKEKQHTDVTEFDPIYKETIISAIDEGDLVPIKSLIEMEIININFEDSQKRSLLQRASYRGNVAIVEYLLKSGASVNHVDSTLNTALYMASEAGHEEIVKILLDFKANVNQADDRGVTPLHIAIDREYVPIIKLLCAKEASVNLRASKINPRTPLALAKEKNNKNIISYLIERGAKDE